MLESLTGPEASGGRFTRISAPAGSDSFFKTSFFSFCFGETLKISLGVFCRPRRANAGPHAEAPEGKRGPVMTSAGKHRPERVEAKVSSLPTIRCTLESNQSGERREGGRGGA